MKHPDDTELTRYAVGETTDPRVEWHVESCPQCAATVERMRASLAAIRAAANVPVDRGSQCLDEHGIAAVAEGNLPSAERDSIVAHLALCAFCRSAVSSVAYARSADGIAKELEPLERVAGGALRRYAVFGVAAAAATLILVARQPVPTPDETHRAVPAAVGTMPVTISPEGPTRAVRVLRWHSVRGADRYRVTLFDADGAVLFETALSDTVAALPDDVEIEAGRAYYWLVASRTDFDRWDTSDLTEFSVDGAGR